MKQKSAVSSVVIGVLLFLVGAAMLVWFIIPVYVGVLNVGNLTGMAVSILWMVVCLFYQQIKRAVIWAWHKSKAGKLWVGFASGLFILAVLCTVALSGMMLYAANRTPPANTTVIVLGCKVNGTVPSLMLDKRLQAAQIYLQNNPQAVCIVSGGQGEGESISEAQAMKNYLLNSGIEANRIFEENQSTNTEENIRFSKSILQQNHLLEQVAIVTDGFHELRAGIIAKKQGLAPYSVSSNTPWFTFSAYYVRELFALMQELILH